MYEIDTEKIAVSVIIPVYNVDYYLRKCLDSVLSQSMKNIEIICVDDGSTDTSPLILAEYAKKDKRITIVTQKNQHLGIARNNGMKYAHGEYIHFLDSDDWMCPNAYEEWYRAANEHGAEVCIGQSITHDMESNSNYVQEFVLGKVSPGYYCNLNSNKHLIYESVVAWNKLYRRTFLEENSLLFDDLAVAEDRYFFFRMLTLAEKIVFIPRIFVEHLRFRPGALTGEHRLINFDCHFKSFEQIWKLFENYDTEIKCMVLQAEMNDFFYFYRRAIGTKYERSVYEQLHAFCNALNLSSFVGVVGETEWYLTYLLCCSVVPERYSYVSEIEKRFHILFEKVQQNVNYVEENKAQKVAEYYENTTSWKITKPIRIVMDFIRSLN